MFKVAPGFNLMQAAANRVEAMINALPAANKATVLSTLGPNDIKAIVFFWYKNFLSKYSGYAFGVYGITNGAVVVTSEDYSAHSGMWIFKESRVPQIVQRLFMAQNPYIDKDGCLVPLINTLDPGSILLQNTYTGTSVYSSFFAPGNNGGAASTAVLLLRWKSLEPLFAQVGNLDLSGTKYTSKLDTSFIQSGNSATGNNVVLGVKSRCPITDLKLSEDFNVSPAISYDTGPLSLTADLVSKGNVTALSSKEYRQYYHRELSGQDTLVTYNLVSASDGLVPAGTQTSNETGNSNVNPPIVQYPVSAPLNYTKEGGLPGDGFQMVRREPPGNLPLLEKLAKRLIPRSGKYCGPGWTAGVDTSDRATYTVGGKYLIDPTDKEDKICKEHDEAYRNADGNSSLIKEADRDMIGKLDNLQSNEGLSFYGHAAKLAIATKLLLS